MIYNTGKGDNRFHRYEYWGIGSYFFMHYVGDCTISEGFCLLLLFMDFPTSWLGTPYTVAITSHL